MSSVANFSRGRKRASSWIAFLSTPLCLCGSVRTLAASPPPEPLTLSAALDEARRANARLPIAAAEISKAREGEREARARKWLEIAIESDVVYSPASGYDVTLSNAGEVRLQAVARKTLLDGGARKAGIALSGAKLSEVRALSRMAEKDVDLEVVSRYAEILAADDEARVRRDGLGRLDRYVTMLDSRRASGEPVGGDILKTRVRRDIESVQLSAAERSAAEARLALNDLMGRDPEAPLSLAGLPDPSPPAPPGGQAEPWVGTPDAEAARARVLEASASLKTVRAEARPMLFGRADAGFWESDTSHLDDFGTRLRHSGGYSLSLNLSWPIFDAGARGARAEAARLGVLQARQEETAQTRESRRSWAEARLALASAWRDIDVLRAAVGPARDAWIEAESRYRGGVASSLEVLDAYTSSIDARIRLAEALLRCRVAQALEERWGTP